MDLHNNPVTLKNHTETLLIFEKVKVKEVNKWDVCRVLVTAAPMKIFSLLLCSFYVGGYEGEKSEHCQSLRVR